MVYCIKGRCRETDLTDGISTEYSLVKKSAVLQETLIGLREDGGVPLPGKEHKLGLDFTAKDLAQSDCSLDIQSLG